MSFGLKKLKKAVTKIIATTLKVSIVLGVFGFIAVESEQLHNNYLRYAVGNSTVRVLSPIGGGGTGFSVEGASGEKFIMTNKHVCESAVNGMMVIKQGDNVGVLRKVVYIDKDHDLCLVAGVKSLKPLRIADSPKNGDFHYIIGHPGLRDLTVSKGELIGYHNVQLLDRVAKRSQCKGKVFELNPLEQMFSGLEFACVRTYRSYSVTSVAYPGNSGSPVVNKYGSVIAVLFAGGQQERDNYAVPLSHIIRVLNLY